MGNYIKKNIKKLFNRKITSKELEELNEWYDSFDDDKVVVFSDQKHSRRKIKNKIHERLLSEISLYRRANYKVSKLTWSVISQFASVAIVLLLISYYFNFLPYTNDENLNNYKIEYLSKTNPKGERSKITLSDGSTIWLNSDSQLKFPENFGSKNREVYLSGEAFFEVSRDESRPFIVHTNQIQTTVLGTSFNIAAYKNSNVSITVNSGKVKVNGETLNKNHFLLKNDRITYFPISGSIRKDQVNSNVYNSWKDGIIIFDNTKLESAVHILENWFDVDIQVQNKELNSKILFGKYDHEKLSNILESLKYTLNIDYTYKGDLIIIK